jgi:hypothetical protein
MSGLMRHCQYARLAPRLILDFRFWILDYKTARRLGSELKVMPKNFQRLVPERGRLVRLSAKARKKAF